MNEGQIKHLELIQRVITRMAQNSFTMKGWAVTLVSAILVVAREVAGWEYLLIALLPAFVFWGFDAFYLRRERLFRNLYDHARLQSDVEWQTDPFTLDIGPYSKNVKGWFRTCWSQSVVWLYSVMVLLIIGTTIYAVSTQHNAQRNHSNGKKSVFQLPL